MSIDAVIIRQVLTTAIAFLLFFWIAKKLFWTNILRAIEERQQRIKSDFERIEQMQQKVNALESDYSKRIAEIEVEARHRMQEAISHGKEVAEQIMDKARAEAAEALEHTKQSIEIEMDKARAELRVDVVRMTLAATEKIIQERVDDRKGRELVSSFIDEISRR